MSRSEPAHATRDISTLQELLRLGLTIVTEVWTYQTGDWVTSVHAADIDDDGDIEILAVSRDGCVYALTKQGNQKWRYEIHKGQEEWPGTIFGIANTKNKTRVIVGAHNNHVYALDKYGKDLQWDFSTGQVVRQVYVQDINADHRLEVLVGSEDRWIYALDSETGKLLWQSHTNGWVRTVFAIDVDGDGTIETLAGSGDKRLYILDSLHGIGKTSHDVKQKIHVLVAADIDKDGIVEIILSTDGKDLYALKLNGQEKWRLHPPPGNRLLSLCLADINNDGYDEIIAGSEDKHLYIVDCHGKLLWRHYLGARVLSVYATDIDRDGLVEIIAGAEDASVHVLHIDLTTNLKQLHQKIIACQKQIGRPSASLGLSPTECMLLQDLTREDTQQERLTTRQASRLLKTGMYTEALSVLLRLQQQKVQMLWGKSKQLGYVRTICFATTAEDAKQKIIVGTGEGEIKALDVHGAIIWSRPLPEQRIVTVQIGDIDGDGEREIVLCTYNRHVYILNTEGTFIGKPLQEQEWISTVYIHEDMQTCRAELIMGSEEKRMYIYDGNLETRNTIVTEQGIKLLYTYDINNDGIAEIIAGTIDNSVYAYSRTGEQLWEYQTWDNVHALCVADIDGDGKPEIMVGSEDRNLHVLDAYGNLKWRYRTPHRVLDVYASDIDQDGKIELLLGVGDGYMYVMNGYGDLLWKYKVNDRVRIVRAHDLNLDKKMEIVIGTEDRLYLLQPISQQWLHKQLDICWLAIQHDRSVREALDELINHKDEYIRAFAITNLAAQTDLNQQDFQLFQRISKDSSPQERIAFAQAIPHLYRADSDLAAPFLDTLAADPEQDVRLALIDSLAALADIYPDVTFEGFKRFIRNVDRWVQRAVVRKLHQLLPNFPEQTFKLLLRSIRTDKNWIRQESARALAHYFDVHTKEIFARTFELLNQSIRPPLLQQIAYSATNPTVQDFCHCLVALLTDLDEKSVEGHLNAMVQAVAKMRTLPEGEETWLVYDELRRIICVRTPEDIAHYHLAFSYERSRGVQRFTKTLDLLRSLDGIAHILRVYLKRDVLLDRMTSLLDANQASRKVYEEVSRELALADERGVRVPEYRVLQLAITRWREQINRELKQLRGKADLQLEMQQRPAQPNEPVNIVLSIHNSGHSPADHVKVTLKKQADFAILGDHVHQFDAISTSGNEEITFTIQSSTATPQLVFEILYSDAQSLDKVFTYSERIILQTVQRPWTYINNPYNSGTPIKTSKMFYGRQNDLHILRECLTNTATNMVVVLSGQRRSGKTSLLYQLVNTDVLEPHIPVFIDMHEEGLEFSQGRFFYHIAVYIQRALKKRGLTVHIPTLQQVNEDPALTFRIFLENVEPLLQNNKLVLLIDEFEVLEERVKEKAIAEEIAKYLRSLMQHSQSLNFLLSGARKMRELTDEYWSVFFNIARQHRLSKLSDTGAIKLITEPVAKTLEYDTLAIKKIRQWTADQPYFIHLLCGYLVEHCNTVQRGYVTLNDVNIVLDKVVETCHNHFTWMWDSSSAEEKQVLAVLAESGGEDGQPLSLFDIEEFCHLHHIPYDQERVVCALENLMKDEIIEGTVGGELTDSVSERSRYRILVGLTRIWLRKGKLLRL